MKLRALTAALAGACAFGAIASANAQDYSDHTAVLHYAEIITADGADDARIIFLQADNGNGQLSGDFVFGDPRNALFDGGIDSVSYAISSENLSSDAGLANQLGDMQLAVDTWNDQTCSDMQLTEVALPAGFPGIVNIFFQGGGIPPIWTADVSQIGFLSGAEFPYFAGNPNVLGVAFTLSWVDGSGNLTDIDENGKSDVAFREIYYNDDFEWSDSGASGGGIFDFPTVAIHEMGHGFSMAHFGLIAVQDGSLVARPRAIMNAIYGGTLREPTGRDVGSHCSNWSQWPNN